MTRWEHVDVTYVETVRRTVRVIVRAEQPLTPEAIEANAEHLTSLAQSVQRQRGDGPRPRTTIEFVQATSVEVEHTGPEQ